MSSKSNPYVSNYSVAPDYFMQVHSVMAVFYFKCSSSINLALSFPVRRGRSCDGKGSAGMGPGCGRAGGSGSGDFLVREDSGEVFSIQNKHTAPEGGFLSLSSLAVFCRNTEVVFWMGN